MDTKYDASNPRKKELAAEIRAEARVTGEWWNRYTQGT